ncbi:MAG: NAD(P)H-dependent oxidoreductase [Methylotenera sp.]|nr:NAD(P)H-dependent oxidoreductase [Methylotenera sp.]
MKVLVVFAHPTFETSRINLALYQSIKDFPDVIWHNLYDTYPQQLINVQHEQALLNEADILLLQHPGLGCIPGRCAIGGF